MTSYKKSAREITAVAFALTFAGLLTQMVAIFSPAWYYTEQKKIKGLNISEPLAPNWYLYEGIWLAKFCASSSCNLNIRENVFSDISISESLSPLDETHWLEIKVLSCLSICGAVISLAACLAASVTAKSTKKRRIGRHNVILITALIGATISFSTLLVPALKLCALLHDDQFTSSWSMVVSLVGCSFQFLAASTIILAFFRNLQQLHRLEQRSERRSRRLQQNVHMMQYLDDCQNATVDAREQIDDARYFIRQSDRSERALSVISPGRLSVVADRRDNETSRSLPRPPPYSKRDALPAYSEITGV